MQKMSPTKRVLAGMKGFTDEQYAKRKRVNKAARKQRKYNRHK